MTKTKDKNFINTMQNKKEKIKNFKNKMEPKSLVFIWEQDNEVRNIE